MTKKEKEINAEIERLTPIFVDIERSKLDIVQGLIEDAAFMRITLSYLKRRINREGATNTMSQGSYSILREHPAAKLYNTMIQRYSSVIKQLTDLFPKEVPKELEDDFDVFVRKR
ncbi:MAG: hypothetical protein AB1Z19_08690 [Eubacteriales bacterium]